MDELSLLVADDIEAVEAAAAAESAVLPLPAPDFTGSLDYIDSLASRRAIALSRRDVANIATAVSTFDYLSPLINLGAVPGPAEAGFSFSTDFRPLGDDRRYDPEKGLRPPRGLTRSAGRVRAPSTPFRVDPSWRNPLDPSRSPGDLERSMRDMERRVLRRPFANWSREFTRPSQLVICLKRKIRRQIMHSMGFAGRAGHYFKRPRFNYWSRVVC